MATVTAIGRFMIKTSRSYCEQNFQAECIYGDTDSIMVKFPFPRDNMSEAECFDYLRVLSTRASNEISSLFPAPNFLEFESVKRIAYFFKKKSYLVNPNSTNSPKNSNNPITILLLGKRIYGPSPG